MYSTRVQLVGWKLPSGPVVRSTVVAEWMEAAILDSYWISYSSTIIVLISV
jgi:hypothetical protein